MTPWYDYRVHFKQLALSNYTIAATLGTHRGGNTPSVSHVGSHQMKVLAEAISRIKLLFTNRGASSLLPTALTSCGLDSGHVKPELHTGGSSGKSCKAGTAATPLCCFTLTTGTETRGINILV